MTKYLILAPIVGLMLSGAATAETPQTEIPARVQQLLACRNLTDGTARLSCFDRETDAVAAAFASKELVAADKDKIRRTKRSLFGLSIPNLGLFGDDGKDEVKQVDGVLAGAGFNRDGGYTFRLQDGARWTQTDGKPIALAPRAGDKVVIRRGALGSYSLSVNGQPGVKVQRIN